MVVLAVVNSEGGQRRWLGTLVEHWAIASGFRNGDGGTVQCGAGWVRE